MSRSARRKRGAITGRQAARCSFCGHMRRFHKEHASNGVAYAVCSKCSINPPYMHAFEEPPEAKFASPAQQTCGELLPDIIGGRCTLHKEHVESSDAVERLHGIRGRFLRR